MQASRIAKPPRAATRTVHNTSKHAGSVYHGAPPVKSMRALGKENEELQVQVKDLSDSLKAANESKASIKAAAERSSKHQQEQINTLQHELSSLKDSSKAELHHLSSALQKASEDFKEKTAEKDAVAEELTKKQKALAEYQSRLERLGIDAVAMKDWAQREESRHKDVEKFDEQIKAAMEELRQSNADLEREVSEAMKVSERIAAAKEKLLLSGQTAAELIGKDEDLDAEDTDTEQEQAAVEQELPQEEDGAAPTEEMEEEGPNEEAEEEEGPNEAEEEEEWNGNIEEEAVEISELAVGEVDVKLEQETQPEQAQGGEQAGAAAEEEALALMAEDGELFETEVQEGGGEDDLADVNTGPEEDQSEEEEAQKEATKATMPTEVEELTPSTEKGEELTDKSAGAALEAVENEEVFADRVSAAECTQESAVAANPVDLAASDSEEAERFRSLRGEESERSHGHRAKRKSFDSAIC